MEEEIQFCLDEAKEKMEKVFSFMQNNLARIRAGKASPALLDGIQIDYYGAKSPLNQVANINTPDAKTLVVKPFDRSILQDLEKAIQESDLGITPLNNGENIILSIPPLTEERRKSLVKQVKQEIESGKISLRNARKDANESLKDLQKEGASEDAVKTAEDKVQELTNSFTKKLDQLLSMKEEEIMKV